MHESTDWAGLDLESSLKRLDASPESGLSQAEVEKRLVEYLSLIHI